MIWMEYGDRIPVVSLISRMIKYELKILLLTKREPEGEPGLSGWKKGAGCRKFLLSNTAENEVLERTV